MLTKDYEKIKQDPEKISPEPAEQEATPQEGGGRHNFNLVSAADLLARPVSETAWIWERILPEGGMSLCVAKPKVGKSSFALALSVAVARGAVFLGRATTQAPVVYLALEEKESEIQKRLAAMGVSDEPLFFHFGLAPSQGTKEVSALVVDSGAGVVIVDTLQKLVRIKDLNDYSKVNGALEPILDVARKRNCHIMLLHHANKNVRDGQVGGDEILGSVALPGAVDTNIILRRQGQRRSFYTIQRYGEDVPETEIVLNDDYSMGARGTLAETQALGDWKKIRSALELQPDMSVPEIIEHSPVSKVNVSVALQWALKQNPPQVERSGGGKRGDPFRYRIPQTQLTRCTPGESKNSPETMMNTNSILPERENRGETIENPKTPIDTASILPESNKAENCDSPYSPCFFPQKAQGRIETGTTCISGILPFPLPDMRAIESGERIVPHQEEPNSGERLDEVEI